MDSQLPFQRYRDLKPFLAVSTAMGQSSESATVKNKFLTPIQKSFTLPHKLYPNGKVPPLLLPKEKSLCHPPCSALQVNSSILELWLPSSHRSVAQLPRKPPNSRELELTIKPRRSGARLSARLLLRMKAASTPLFQAPIGSRSPAAKECLSFTLRQ